MRKVVITRVLSEPAFRSQFEELLSLFAAAFPADISIYFGFAWSNRFDHLELPISHPDEIRKLVSEAESAHAGTLGSDNLHIYWEEKRNELLFCHESDIHLIFEESSALIESILQTWERQDLILHQ